MNPTASNQNAKLDRIGIGRVLFALVALLVVVWLADGFYGLFGGSRLTYQGKSLEAWLRDLDFSKPAAVQQEGMEAVKHIGSNSIPTLLSWMSARDSGFEFKANHLLSKQRFVHWRYLLAAEKATSASRAFQALGPQGASAIPKLTQLFNDPKYHQYAAGAFAGIGEPAVEAVTPFLTNSNRRIREEAARVLAAIGKKPDVVLPALSAQVPESSSAVRGLGEYGLAATSHVGELRKLLYGDARYTIDAASSLAGLGDEGLVALVEASGSSNLTTRRVAAAGLGWHRYQHSTNPPPPTQGPENPLTKLMRQQCTFNMMAMQMTYMMYSQGDADTLLPLLSSYTDSTNQQLREAAVLAKKQVTEHPLVKKKLGVQPFMSGRPPASLPPPQRETDSATHGNK